MTRINSSPGRISVAQLLDNAQARAELEDLGIDQDALKAAASQDGLLSRSEMTGLLSASPSRFPPELRRVFALLTGGVDLQSKAPVNSVPGAGISAFDLQVQAIRSRKASAVNVTGLSAPAGAPVQLHKPLTVVDNNAGFRKRDKNALVYVSASTVSQLGSKLSNMDDNSGAHSYASALGALGSYGPLGAYGPLASLGGIGNNSWNPSQWFDSASVDTTWSMTQGPLSEAGPLGENGPLSDIYYDGELFAHNDFAQHLRGLGMFSVLGPLGPLGPLGALGPLGPNGAHGFGADRDGHYFNTEGDLQRKVSVWYDKGHTLKREYDLFERYTEAQAKCMTDNDTSFMVEGRISYVDGDYETDAFEFTSATDQLVTIAVVPEKQLDDFDFEITDQHNNVLLSSDSGDLIDWAQMQVSAGTKLKVKVKLASSGHWLSKDYRLFVTGAGEQLSKSTIAD
jgi:hypothetical protein